jgi:hypothetical protein
MQRLCHSRLVAPTFLLVCLAVTIAAGADKAADAPATNDYPTVARVEYVNDCIAANGGKLAGLYQCSCAIDRIAAQMNYDEFVQAGTFSKYATLPGEGGGIFRDSDEAKRLAKKFRQIEGEARRGCGLQK